MTRGPAPEGGSTMRASITVTNVLAATLLAGWPALASGQSQPQKEGSEATRIVRRDNTRNENPENQGSRSERLKRRLVQRMREGSGATGNGEGVWLREFPDPAPYPVVVEPVGDSFTISSNSRGLLRSVTNQPMYTDSQCQVVLVSTPTESGVDMTYTISNPTETMQAMPTLQVGGFSLADRIEYLDHRTGCQWITLDASGGQGAWSPTAPYPQSLYSPVIIARDNSVAVGLSLEYPLQRYQHQIRTYMGRGTGINGSTWTAKFYLDGELAPAESRDYVVNLRYTHRDDWIHTIAPYKEAFARHGSVRYHQDLRPVWGMAVSDSLLINHSNPRGFRGTRADLNGWQGDVDYMLDFVIPAGFERVMVWAPSGMYDQNRQNNYPPQFMVDWTGPMLETASQWTRFKDAGVDLLFWWGRSGQYADRWNDDTLDKFDPTLPAEGRMMLDQWRTALQRGASGLGLDAFTQMDGWRNIAWIAALRELKPDATIVAEPACFDLLNLHVPTSLYSTDVDGGPHYLADYLVPGREMWVLPHDGPMTLERAEQLIGDGMTVLLRGRDISAHDLQDAVQRAQGGSNGGH